MLIDENAKIEIRKKINNCKILGTRLMSDDDFKRAEIVIKQFEQYTFPKTKLCGRQDAVDNAYKHLTIYNDSSLIRKIKEKNTKIKLYKNYNDNYTCNTHIVFSTEDNGEIDAKSGTLEHYVLPAETNELTSLFLAHEFNHALKETNLKEFQDSLVLSEVIPLFFELICLDKTNIDNKKKFLQARMYLMKETSEYYNEAKARKNEEEELFTFIQSDAGKYPNNFYLALLLYNMYNKKPKLVLETVKKVLHHQLTTSEMLHKLGIYTIINSDAIVTTELNKINKLLRK